MIQNNNTSKTQDKILYRQSPYTIYSKFTKPLNQGENPIINPLYKSFLEDTLAKNLIDTHPNEVLIKYNFVSHQKYREVMSLFYQAPIKEMNIEEISTSPTKKIFNLQEIPLSAELKKTVSEELEAVANDYNLIPVYSEGSVLYWAVKEPETDEKTPTHLNSSYSYCQWNIEIDKILSIVKKISSKMSNSFSSTDLSIITNVDYINIVKYLEKHTNTKYKYLPTPFNIRYYVRKIMIDGVVKGASDIQIWGNVKGNKAFIEYQYTILNDTTPAKTLIVSPKDFQAMESEVWSWAGVEVSSRSTYNIREYDIPNLLGEPSDSITYRGRLNLVPDRASCDKYCIRVVDPEKGIIPFPEFNLSPNVKRVISDSVYYNDSGLVVLSGATGSGKSTALRSIISYLLQTRPFHRIESIEAPIEVVMNGIVQINIDDKNEITPKDIIKALTRRNAKIINLNEINSTELFKFSVDAVLMSLLVLTTIHTSSVSTIPDRALGLIDAENRYLYRQFLQCSRLFLHLTMLKEACPRCCDRVDIQEDSRITNDQAQLLAYYGYTEPTVYMPKKERDENCPICEGLTFQIRNPIVCTDYLFINNQVQDMLRTTADFEMSHKIKQYQMANGTTGVHDALSYLKENKVTFDQIYQRFSLINEIGSHLQRDELTDKQEQRLGRSL